MFIVIEKAKNETRNYQYTTPNTPQVAPPKVQNKAPDSKKDPSYPDKSRNNNFQKEIRKDAPQGHNYPYNITKINPSPIKQ